MTSALPPTGSTPTGSATPGSGTTGSTPTGSGTTGSARVARSEDELLRIARGLVGVGRPPPRARAAQPVTRIGPTAMALLQQTLARGVPASLLRGGGWETRRTLVDGSPRTGRLWERHPTLPTLRFGPASIELLIWLHREDLVRPSTELARAPNPTLADEVLHFLACEQLVAAGIDVRQPGFQASALCQLGFPDSLASASSDLPLPSVDWSSLAESKDAAILVEALQSRLARHWVATERRKGAIVLLEDMTRVGRAQTQVLDGWFAALERAQANDPARARLDLATFVAEAGRTLLAAGPERRCPDFRWWVRSLSVHAPLSARQAAFTHAGALLRGIGRLGRWLDEAGVVAHFDEDYEAAQLLLSSWQYLRARPAPATRPAPVHDPSPSIPAAILDRAAALANTLESLHSLGAGDSSAPTPLELP